MLTSNNNSYKVFDELLSEFEDGLALVELDTSNNTVCTINTKGRVVFTFNKDTFLSGTGHTHYLQTLIDKPSNKFYAYVDNNSDSDNLSDSINLTIYEKNGKRFYKELSYNKISTFYKGKANLYKLSRSYLVDWFNDTKKWQFEYKPVASIDVNGTISKTIVEEEPPSKSNGLDEYGFTSDSHNDKVSIKNKLGKTIYTYSNNEPNSYHHYINEKLLLVPVKKNDGTIALTLMDSNGNLHSQYTYSKFMGSFENRFFAKPYKSLKQKQAYLNRTDKTAEKEWLDKINSSFSSIAKDTPIDGLQQLTLYQSTY